MPWTKREDLRRLEAALADVDARGADGREVDFGSRDEERGRARDEWRTAQGVREPTSMRSYDDLRRAGTREPLR